MCEKSLIKTTSGSKCSVFYTDLPNGSWVYAVYCERSKRYLSLKEIPRDIKRVLKVMRFKIALYDAKTLNQMGV